MLVPYYSLALKTRSGVFLEHCFLFKANQLLLNIASWNGSQNSTDRQQKLSLGPLTYLGNAICCIEKETNYKWTHMYGGLEVP